MNKTQSIQEEQYALPYHYVPQYKEGFSQTLEWSWGLNYVSTVEFIISKIGEEQFKTIVDVGCGDGRLTRELFFEFGGQANVAGIDYSPTAIRLAQAMNPNIQFENVNIYSESNIEKYDVIVLMEVFEHIPLDQCEEFVLALYGMLNEKGCIYLTVPHCNKPIGEKHFQHFDEVKLEKYFRKYFDVEEVVFFENIYSIKYKIIKKLLSNKFFMLNNKFLLDYIYRYYKKNLFVADDEKRCSRIFTKLRRVTS
jgi:2-polyprenyl-3-methyl-5-hydroxy-6-metoxy-1,4-benzoquinol methylase